MTDLDAWVKRAQGGDAEAFDRIVRRLQDMAVGYAYSLLGDFHLAEDAAQEAFIAAYGSLAQLRTVEAFSGWFQRILVRSCRQLRRRERLRTLPLEEAGELVSHAPGPGEVAESRAERGEILDAI